MKCNLTFLFFFICNSIFSQSIIKGLLISSPSNEPIGGVELAFYYNYNRNNESVFEATTNSEGEFKFNCNGIKLPSTFLVKIKKGDLINEEQHKFISVDKVVKLKIHLNSNITQEVVESLSTDIKNIKSEVEEIKGIIINENIIVSPDMELELENLSTLLDSKQDSINSLKGRLSIVNYGNWEKDKSIKGLNRDVEELKELLSQFKIKLNNVTNGLEEAHLKIVNCHCEERNINEGYITIGFDVLDTQNEYLESGYKKIRIELFKLSNVKKNTKRVKLTNRETKETYVEKNIMFPQSERIRISFPVDPDDIKWKSNNYYIKIYNLGYRDDVDLAEIEISNLKSECFKRTHSERKMLFNNKVVEIENLVEVSVNQISISIYDELPDKDVISIYLNETPIIENLEVTKSEKIIPISLPFDENLLIIESNDMGENEPNTTKIKIIERGSEKIITLDSYKNKSAGARIIVKE